MTVLQDDHRHKEQGNEKDGKENNGKSRAQLNGVDFPNRMNALPTKKKRMVVLMAIAVLSPLIT